MLGKDIHVGRKLRIQPQLGYRLITDNEKVTYKKSSFLALNEFNAFRSIFLKAKLRV